MRIRWLYVVVAVLLIGVMAGCGPIVPLTGGAQQNLASSDLAVNQLALPGRVVPRSSVNLSFPIAGAVKTVSVALGSQVKTGDVLAELDTRELEREVRRAESALQVALASLQRRQMGASPADLSKAESDLLTAQAAPVPMLRATAQAATIKALEERITYLRSLPLPEEVAVAQAEVTRAQAELEAARSNLDLAVLRAPFDGIVTAIGLNVYEYASPGRTVVQLTNNADLYVEFRISDVDLARFSTGQTVGVAFPGVSDTVVDGQIESILPTDSRSPSGMYTARVNLSGPVPQLSIGMSASVLPSD